MLQKTKESINSRTQWEDEKWELQIQSNDHWETSKTNENLCRTNEKLQKMDAPRFLIIFATRAACQIVGDWLPASVRINYRGHQGQQKRTWLLSRLNQNHIIKDHNQIISDSNTLLTGHSPAVVLHNQVYSEAMQKPARDSSVVVPEFSERSCKIASP